MIVFVKYFNIENGAGYTGAMQLLFWLRTQMKYTSEKPMTVCMFV